MTDRVRLRLRGRMGERFIGRALQMGVRFQSVERTDVRELTLCVTEKNARILLELAGQYGMDVCVLDESGRPAIKKRMRARSSLPLGLMLSILLMTTFTARIWRVEAISLDGAADEYTLRAVCQSASRLGARPGALRGDIDRDELAMRLHAEWPELTHVSVRLDGVYLRVEIAAEEPAPEVYQIDTARDLVAARDAMIVYVEPLAGKVCVKPGDIVRKGQTLIRGEERIDTEATRAIRALGKAIGRVWFTAECRMPVNETVSRRTGKYRVRAHVRLFDWKWTLAAAEDYESQQAETEILPIGGLYLPIRIEREILWETVISSAEKDRKALKEEVAAQAIQQARFKLPPEAKETDCRVEITEENGMLTAHATIEAEMNIAAENGQMVD